MQEEINAKANHALENYDVRDSVDRICYVDGYVEGYTQAQADSLADKGKTILEKAHELYVGTDAGKERTYNESLGNAFIRGAEWAKEEIISKAAEWIYNNQPTIGDSMLEYIDKFRKAMTE